MVTCYYVLFGATATKIFLRYRIKEKNEMIVKESESILC